MPAKRVRFEISDAEGNRYLVEFKGQITREKALRLLDIVELLGGIQNAKEKQESVICVSKFDKTRLLLRKHFPYSWFSSGEVLTIYEEEYKEPISLSTVSTYLGRMTDRGLLMRRGPPRNRQYRLPAVASTQMLRAV